MYQNKNITSLIKYLFYNTKNIIMNDLYGFINLVLINSLLLIGITLINNWISASINIFDPIFGIIVLRIALALIISGLWIGYFKLIFAYIDHNKFKIKTLFINFDVLPKIVIVQSIYYLTTIPLFLFIIKKIPYNINEHGTNINNYFYSIISSFELSGVKLSGYDIIIIIFLSLGPIIYLLHFWCAELLIIDQSSSIKRALKTSYIINNNIKQFILLIILIFSINVLSVLFGYFIFIIVLTLSYMVMFQYYRMLQKDS